MFNPCSLKLKLCLLNSINNKDTFIDRKINNQIYRKVHRYEANAIKYYATINNLK